MSSGNYCLLSSSILRKQIVAVTGLMLVGFVAMHLMGNFIIFLGPKAFNAYAEKLQELGPLLWAARLGLIVIALVHVSLTILLTLENRKATPGKYAVSNSKRDRDFAFARKTMIYTGILIVCFLGLHLSDFSLADKTGPASIVADGTLSAPNLGLYGLVMNSFRIPWRAGLYIVCMIVLGLHLSHAIQSFFQTLGLFGEKFSSHVRLLSMLIGAAVALGFIAIPVYFNLIP